MIDKKKLPPLKRKLYPLSKPELKELREQLKVLVDSGRIVSSASPYGAPILFAAQKVGAGLQMCTDYRSLNCNTVPNSFPLHRIDELLVHLHGSKIFSKLDLCDGYKQIPIAQRDCHRIVFNYRYGIFDFRVMQFGSNNAPAHFQRTMNQLFSDMANVCVVVYFDDIQIFNIDEQDHKQHIHAVLKRLAQQNFHVNPEKCTLFTDSIEFLGHVVSARGIEVCPKQIGAIRDRPILTSVGDV